MSNFYQRSPEFSSKKQITGFDCNLAILKDIDAIAEAINWSRNKFIEKCIVHTIQLIENFTYPSTPKFVNEVFELSQFDPNIFSSKKLTTVKVHKIHRTAISLHPIILKKVGHISHSVGWSRTAFIIAAMSHILSIIKNEATDPIPNIVKIARAIIPAANFTMTETDQSKPQDQTSNRCS